MSDMEAGIRDLQNDAFLQRLNQVAGGDPTMRINAATVGDELGLPLERTLEIVEALAARGALHRCSKLIDGPEVHLTPQGIHQEEPAGE